MFSILAPGILISFIERSVVPVFSNVRLTFTLSGPQVTSLSAICSVSVVVKVPWIQATATSEVVITIAVSIMMAARRLTAFLLLGGFFIWVVDLLLVRICCMG